MSKNKWDGNIRSVESCLLDFINHNQITSELVPGSGGTQRIQDNGDGTLTVDWFGEDKNSKKGHFHFVFEVNESGKPYNGRFVGKG